MNALRTWLQRVRGFLAPPDGIERVRPDEIGVAIRALYGVRYARRKRQRTRKHITYKQRDAIAWLLIRLQHERGELQPMTRNDWVYHFTDYMHRLSDFDAMRIAEAAEQRADSQRDQTGTEDAAMWQTPDAAAQQTLNEWLDPNAEQANETRPDEDMPDDAPPAQPLPGGEPVADPPEPIPTEPPQQGAPGAGDAEENER